jgi:hypothetical protein
LQELIKKIIFVDVMNSMVVNCDDEKMFFPPDDDDNRMTKKMKEQYFHLSRAMMSPTEVF